MARTDTLPHFLTDVADAIRTKGGTSETIQASSFDTAIASLPSGVNINDYFTLSSDTEGYYAMALIKKFPYAIDIGHKADGSNKFSGFRNLEEAKVINAENVTSVAFMFGNCVSLQYIDIRDMTINDSTSGYTTIFGSSSSNRVPDNCLIVVKDQTQKDWFNSRLSRYTNVVTVEEYNAMQ